MPTAALRITDWKKFSSRKISDKDLWFFKRKLNFLKVRRNKFPSERVTPHLPEAAFMTNGPPPAQAALTSLRRKSEDLQAVPWAGAQ